jgi:hypothetical protein
MTSAFGPGELMGLVFLVCALPPDRPASPRPSDLRETLQRQMVEAERLERVVAEAIRKADAVGRTNPTRAVDILKAAKAQFDAVGELLEPERREALLRQITQALRTWDTRPDLGEFRAWREFEKQGYFFLRPDRVVPRNEDSVPPLVRAVPPFDGSAFPDNWESVARQRNLLINLTETERKIVKTLNTLMSYEVEGKTLKEALDELRERTKMPIVVDERALNDLKITENVPVKLELKNMTTRTVLRRLLGDVQLTYVMHDQTIRITTPARAREMLKTRVYSVADLMPLSGGGIPTVFGQAQAYQTLQMLVVLVTQTVEPDSWEVNGKGGLGTITFDPKRFVLVVKQTTEMHYLLGLSAGMK